MDLKPSDLITICRGIKNRMDLDPLYLVLASASTGQPHFIQISEESQFEAELRQALTEEDFKALGLLGWEE